MNPEARMSDDEYFAFCMANRATRFQRSTSGEIFIGPPAGAESAYQRLEVSGQLREWGKRDGRGKSFGSSIEFILPNKAALSPDAAWVSNQRLSTLPKEQRQKFPPVCPEFVVEVMSPSDRLKAAKNKMGDWLAGGVELGWLVEPEKLTGVAKLSGDGPLAGFELDLTDIWAGL